MRMITQDKMTGTITESIFVDPESLIRSMEPQERRFIFRFMEAIRNFLYGLSGRTAAETKFLRETADAISRMSQRITRNLAKNNETLPVSMNYFTPKESITETTQKQGEQAKAREELRKDTGLNRANLQFLKDYAKELGIKVPTTKRKVIVFNEETRKHEEKEFKLPFWKKADYVNAIRAKLEELGKKQKDLKDEDYLGSALPTDRPYWLKPDGEVVDVEETALVDLMSVGSHAESAIGWLEENEPETPFLTEWKLLDPLDRKERQQLPVLEMFKKGWLRVVGDAFNLYFEGNPNQTQLDRLFEAAINDEVKLIQDMSSLSGRARSKTLYEPPLEDELGAAMPRHGFSTTEPKVSIDWSELPDSLEGLEQVDVRPGTFDVRVYMDENGLQYVVKRGQTQEQFENEIAAENIYRLLNYPVPRSRLITLSNGETAKLSEYIFGPTLAQFVNQMRETDPGAVQKVMEEIGDGLLIDAFLFNYDVLGEGLDNIIVAHEEVFDQDVIESGVPSTVKYTPYRVDNGGTFDTRAMGMRREEPFFYDSFAKLQDKYPEINLRAGDMLAQISDLVLNSDQILNSVPERVRPMMAQRLQWMADQFSAMDTMPASIGYTDEEIVDHFTRLSAEMASVEVTRNAQGQLINKATGRPSEIKLLNAKGEVIRTEPKSEFRYRLERTPSFKMWFGDWENFPEGKGTSKILDEAGEPLVMFHGTSWDKRQLAYLLPEEREIGDFKNRFYPMKTFSTGNLFRGLWVSTSRQFAEEWANSSTFEEYNEQVVLPLYIKSTNPFDPRNPNHVAKLIAYAREKGKAFVAPEKVPLAIATRLGFSLNPTRQLALENGFYDWTVFEGSEPGSKTPPIGAEYDELSDAERKRRFFALFPYSTLEAIINLGFDAVWVKEKQLGLPGSIELNPKHRIDEMIAARQLNDQAAEEKARRGLEEDLANYNNNSSWNLLLWRPDGAKSAVNSGKFKTRQQIKEFQPIKEAMSRSGQVKRNNKTLWNEYVKDGITYASYDTPEKLVSYAFMTANQLSKNNIAKD